MMLSKQRLTGLLVAAAVIVAVLSPGSTARASDGNSIETLNSSGSDASLALDAAGNPVVSYPDINVSTYYLTVIHCNDPKCTGGGETKTTPDPSSGGFESSIALDASGYPVVAYTATGQLKLLHCDDANCSGTETINTVASIGTSARPSLQLDASGYPVVSYYDSSAADLKLLHCNDVNCAGGDESLTTPSQTGSVGRYSSLALDSSGDPYISYYDATDSELEIADCSNPNCSSGVLRITLDSVGDAGYFSSLALDPSGTPVIAYRVGSGSSTKELRVARCDDAACLGTPTISTVDTISSGGSPGEHITGISLRLDSSGAPVVSYSTWTNLIGNPYLLRVRHCSDGTCSGGNAMVSIGTEGGETSLVIDASGNPVVAQSRSTSGGSSSDLQLVHCADPNCWGDSTLVVDSTGGGYSSITRDAAGNPVISYLYYSGGNPLLGIAHCSDPKCLNRTVNSPDTVNTGYYTSIALDAAGNPVVSHHDLATGDLKILHCNDPACAGGDESITAPHTTGNMGRYTSLALDGSGFPVVSYFDATNDDLYVMHCNDANCAGNNESIEMQDSAGQVGEYTSLALDASGFPVVSYYDRTNGNLRVRHCNDANCSGGNESITTPVFSGDVGKFPSLELDGSGFPVVSYYRTEDGYLYLMHCNDANCSGGNESIVVQDQTEVAGFFYTSLELDASGFPVISYFDYANGDLKLIHCNDVNCTGAAESTTTPDTANDVGNYSSLMLDSVGNPVVSYYDETNGSLRLLHCNDANCEPGVKTSAPPNGDTDGDGCPDVDEQQTAVGSELTGGRRDYLNPSDYFNPSDDGQNRVDDILLVVQAYFDDDDDGNPGLPPYEPGYNPAYDRTYVGPLAWNLGPPNGLQRVDDILNQVKQYFHDCA